MKASELRDMSVEELQTKLTELKEELFNLRFQLAVNQQIGRASCRERV